MTGSNALKKDVEITGLAADSRAIEPGYLFAALPGAAHDGRAFVDEAIARGAAAVLAPEGSGIALEDIPVIEDAEPRRRFAHLAARFYGAQPEVVSAVTGTNGKTSVASFVRQMWAHMGLKAASMGTLGISAPGIEEPGSLTTPDPVALHAALARLAEAGVSHLAMEASSHGLQQYRLDGVRLEAAAFTNLTRDHLDYHGTEDAYFAAKARLFGELLPEGAMAVLNADSPAFGALADICTRRRQRVITFGIEGSDVRILRARPHGLGQAVSIEFAGRRRDLHVPLVGAFQIHNVACALGLVAACGGEADAACEAAATLEGAPGRMQLVGSLANGAAVFVDYAHTPDALANALAALRPHTAGRLVVVFGCGGDRDPGKRAEMGRIAADAADEVIVTDDNPRSEDPGAIRAAIALGARGAKRLNMIGERREAIAAGVHALGAGDVLLVAGKGHERGQIVGDVILPFYDADEVSAAIRARDGAR